METIVTYSCQADLAFAAYATLAKGVPDTSKLEAIGMSSIQAVEFAKRWKVIDSVEFLNGAAATVFEEIGKPGVRYLAVRGTELGNADLLADEILALGFPSFVNPQFVALRGQIQAWMDSGTLPASFTIAGHSLGGYLAAAIGSWFRSGSAYMYNAPGVGGVVGNAFDALKTALGLENMALVSDIYNFRGSEGISIITGLGAQLAPPTMIQIEAAFGGALGPGNHSVVRLADSFAVYALYASLSPSLDLEQIGSLLKAASSQSDLTLETALDALRLALLGKSVPRTPEGDRDKFYGHLLDLQNHNTFQALAGKARIESLSSLGSSTLATLAESGADALAYRYALKALNPFAVLGADYGIHNGNGELDLYNPGSGEGELTRQYLNDRALMLSGVVEANLRDTGNGKALHNEVFTTSLSYFEDKASGLSLREVNAFGVGSERQRYVFGDENNDVLFGTAGVDHLYGGSGMDRLDGGAGNDYLEGGSGADILSGGKGDDRLVGGTGLDSYVFRSGDGWDTIEDADGLGAIYYDDVKLTGGKAEGESGRVWKQEVEGKTFWYILTEWTEGGETYQRLSIEGADGGVSINRWQAGQLGIVLPGSTSEPPPATQAEVRTVSNLWHNAAHVLVDARESAPGMTVALGAYGEVLGNGWLVGNEFDNRLIAGGGDDLLQGGEGRDVLIGEGGKDLLDGGEGGDALAGGDGEDILEGGEGNDVLAGGLGRDRLIGGAGSDVLHGGGSVAATDSGWSVQHVPGAINNTILLDHFDGELNVEGDGDDFLLGGDGDDWLWGGWGDDYLDGGADHDQLVGDGGNDRLYGGSGNDRLFGDGSSSQFDEHYTLAQFHGDDFLDGGDGDDRLYGDGGNDELHGGEGDDELHGDTDGAAAPFGNDRLYGGAGKDLLIGGGGDDTLDGGDGDDVLAGDGDGTANEGNDVLYGGAGNDTLVGGGGDDVLMGGEGDDILQGDAGNDTLIGGGGSNHLAGGEGDDIYRGVSGKDTISDHQGNNTIHLSSANAVEAGGLSVSAFGTAAGGSSGRQIDLRLGNGETLSLQNAFFAEGTTNIVFANGERFDLESLVGNNLLTPMLLGLHDNGGRVFGGAGNDVLTGGEGKDTLVGHRGNDSLLGGGGDDRLEGGDGDDTLIGGLGDDTLIGGAGRDTYHLGLGQGFDTVFESAGETSLIRLGSGLSVGDILFAREGDDLRLTIAGTSNDGMRLSGYFSAAANWLIDAGQGEQSLADLVNAQGSDGGSRSPYEQALASWRREVGQAHLAELAANGYKLGGDGLYHQFESTASTSSSYTLHRINDGVVSDVLVEADPGLVVGSRRESVSFETQETLTQLSGGQGSANSGGSHATEAFFIPAGISSFEYPLGSILRPLVNANGVFEGTWVYPPDGNGGGGVSFRNTVTTERHRYVVQEVVAGDGDNIISDYYGGGPVAVDAGAGNDVVSVDGVLYGNAGNDILTGGLGNDFLIGGQGADTLDGGYGADRYYLENEAPLDLIVDRGDTLPLGNYLYSGRPGEYLAKANDLDKVIFPDGVGPGDLSFSWHNELVRWPERFYRGLGVALHRQDDPVSMTAILTIKWGSGFGMRVAIPHSDVVAGGIELFQFADGSVLTRDQLLAMAPQHDLDPHLGDNVLNAGGSVAGLAGNDIMMGAADSDFLDGGDGDDQLFGGDGNDHLSGGRGADSLSGGDGEDTLGIGGLEFWGTGNIYQGGRGDDLLLGTVNTDIYLFELGDGADVVSDYYHAGSYERMFGNYTDVYYGGPAYLAEAGAPPDFNKYDFSPRPYLGKDVLRFGAGISSDDISLVRDEQDLIVVYSAQGDSVRLKNWFDDLPNSIDRLEFADGTVWDGARLRNIGGESIIGSPGDDTLVGTRMNDTIAGLGGDDVLVGGEGDDTFVFGVGDGADVINDFGLGGDRLVFGEGIAADDLRFVNDNGALLILRVGSADTLKLTGWFDASVPSAILEFADGSMLDAEEIVRRSTSFNAVPTAGADLLRGSGGNDVIRAAAGNDWVDGGAGNDTIFGGEGNDTLLGGAGDDTLYGNGGDNILDGGDGNDILYGSLGKDRLLGGAGDDTLYAVGGANNVLDGGDGNDQLFGALSDDTLVGGSGNNTIRAGGGNNTVTSGAGNDRIFAEWGNDIIDAGDGDNYVDAGGGNDVVLAGSGSDTVKTGWGNDFVHAGGGSDVVTSTLGNDILFGGDGQDHLSGGYGNSLIDGGNGDDILVSQYVTDVLIGGKGNDLITTGGGKDILLFNRNDGRDTLSAGLYGKGTLSLGGGITYDDLAFAKDGSDLLLKVGGDDQITFKNWYKASSNRGVVNLQLIAEAMDGFSAASGDPMLDQKTEQFDFKGLVGAFDAAREKNGALSEWALTNALSSFHLGGSDTTAFGGDLAYQYGRFGSLASIGLSAGQNILDDGLLGTGKQSLQTASLAQPGEIRLG